MRLISKSDIEDATARLAAAYQPEAIYLFGSYAWGEPNKDSDLDFYIVLKEDAAMAWDAFRIANHALWSFPYPVDVIVNKHDVFEQRATHPSSLEFKIKKQGILYDCSHGMAA